MHLPVLPWPSVCPPNGWQVPLLLWRASRLRLAGASARSARLGVAIVASATRLDSTLSQELRWSKPALASHVTSCRLLCCGALVCSFGTLECWGGRQGGRGPELCVRLLRVCGSQLAVCLVSLFVSVCRSCVPSSSVQRPPIPRWCPVRAWLFFTLLQTYILGTGLARTGTNTKKNFTTKLPRAKKTFKIRHQIRLVGTCLSSTQP